MSRNYSDDDFGNIRDVSLRDLVRNKKPVDKPIVIVLLFFTVLLLLGALVTLFSSSGRSKSYHDFMSDAVIVTARCSNVHAEHSRHVNQYYADITYEYNGTVYTGRQMQIGQEVQDGDAITIYIDPDDPSNIKRKDNTAEGLKIESAIGYCLLVVGIILLIISVVVIINNIKFKRLHKDGYQDEPINQPNSKKIETYAGYDDIHTYNDNGYVHNNDSVSVSQENTTVSNKEVVRVIRIVISLIILVQLIFSGLNIIPAIIKKTNNDNFMQTAVSVEGVCDSVRVEKHHHSGDANTTYIYYAKIRYIYEDQQYLSGEIEVSDGIAKGEPYTLYVDPNNPSDSRVPYVLNMFEIILYSFMAIIVTTIGLIFYKGLKNAVQKEEQHFAKN